MTRHRRAFVPGASYFFTVNLADRRAALLADHIDPPRDAIRYARKRHPFEIDAMVVLSDHLHAVWTLPPDHFRLADALSRPGSLATYRMAIIDAPARPARENAESDDVGTGST